MTEAKRSRGRPRVYSYSGETVRERDAVRQRASRWRAKQILLDPQFLEKEEARKRLESALKHLGGRIRSTGQFEVYIVRNKINGKIYVGQTQSGFATRWTRHLNNVKYGDRGSRSHFHSAIRKHGTESFELIGILELGDEQRKPGILNAMEIGLIQRLGSTDASKGYNMAIGGDNNAPWTPERRQELSKKLKKLWTPERRQQAAERFNSPEFQKLLAEGLDKYKRLLKKKKKPKRKKNKPKRKSQAKPALRRPVASIQDRVLARPGILSTEQVMKILRIERRAA
jgi:group I intron endonuclease